MSAAVQAVIDALADLATPRRVLGDQLDDLEQRRQRSLDELVGWFSPSDDDRVEFEYEDPATDALEMPELEDALRSFVDGAQPDWTTIPIRSRLLRPSTGEIYEYDVVRALADSRSEIDKDLREVGANVAAARERLDAAFAPVRDRLRDWLDDVLTGAEASPAEWGRIQKAWRASLALPMREAATLLDVSSAAVARYETGARTQSSAALRLMVDRLLDVGPTAGLDTQRFIRSLSQMGLDFSIDSDAGPALIASIEDRLQDLTTSQLRFIEVLLADAQALDQFMQWMAKTPTGLLRAAASSVATR